VPQTFHGHATATTLQGAHQTIARGPAASQVAIKQLGTNGGGYYNSNSAVPFENPSGLSNFLEMLAILLIPAAQVFMFGKLVLARRHAWMIFISMFVVFALATAGAQAKKVVAYTAHEDNIVASMVPRFKAETGYDLEFVKLASGDVIKRVKAEAGNPQCDVIWSIGGEQLEADSDLLAKYVPKEWDKIAPVFKVGTNWLPYTGIMNVLIVNTKLVSNAETPKSWADLTNPKWKGKICSATPDKSGSAYMQMNNVFLAFKDKGWDMYKPILANFYYLYPRISPFLYSFSFCSQRKGEIRG